MDTVEYAPGRSADLYGDAGQPIVVIWHGMQSDARAAVRTLADRVEGHGLAVVAPDWDSQADDRGRRDLLESVRFAQRLETRGDGITLVGWSMGGLAAAGLTVAAARHDVRLRHTVCLAGAFTVPDPITGARPAAQLGNGDLRTPFTLLHGLDDDVVPVSASRDFASELSRHAWPVDLVELDADHASIAGATYDSAAGRYDAANDERTVAIAEVVADRVAAVSR